jgi:glycosyltransferase involved in cell wall biosynthesis
MRILIASGIFHPEPGGPATYLYRLLPELQTAGHHVTALAFGDAPVEGYPYPLTRIPRRNYLRRRWDYYRAARRLWPGHDLAYIHSLGLPLPSTIRPRVAKIVGDPAWERAVNKGWVGADTDVDRFQVARYGPTVEANKALRAREARRLDHVIVPGEYLRRMVLGWGVEPGRVSVIYNALETPPDALPETQANARAALGLPAGPLLLTAARLTPWKGIDHTLRALWRYFRAADYTLLYSGYEGLPHVLLESLSAGTPVIAGDKGGSPEVVEHGVNGLLVPHVNVEALAGAIEAAFAPGRRAALAANTAVGLERFSPARMVEQTLAVLARFA